jgi:hypothetical protein
MAPKRVIIHHQISRFFEVLPMREDRGEEKANEKKEFSVCTRRIATYVCAAAKKGNCFWFSEILKRTIDHETGCGWWTATSCDEHRMRQGMAPLPDTR